MKLFEIEKEIIFRASHKLYVGGRKDEQDHFHDWKISAAIRSNNYLNDFGFGYDYDLIEQHLNEIAEPIKNQSFNKIEPFNIENLTAEKIAKFFADNLAKKIPSDLILYYVKVCKEKDIAIYYL